MITAFQNIKYQKLWCSIILILCLIPTYFIHSQKYPDWGDDFAQYVYQSQQINTPSDAYRQVLNVEEYSSPKRSVFFSVVLSVVNPTLQIQNYVNLISITYIIAGLVFFLFLTNYFSISISIIGTLSVFYNFLFLRLKAEVVPEFIFITLFYGVLFIVFQNKKWAKYVIPILLGMLVSVRFVGISLLLSYICVILLQKDKNLKEKLKSIGISLIIFGLVISFINYFFLSSIHNQEVTLYSNIIKDRFNPYYIFDNIATYSRYVLFFFEQEIPYWINPIITFFALLFFIIGFLNSLIKQKNILHFAFVFYLLFLVVYPSKTDIIKYLIPILPLLFYFIILGLKILLERIHFKHQNLILIGFLVIVFFSNSKTIWLAKKHIDTSITPYETDVLYDFEEIKRIVEPAQNIAFGKPFIINLLADRNAYFLSTKNYEQVFKKAGYVLSPKQKIKELYPKIEGIKMTKGDTIELSNFYLVKL